MSSTKISSREFNQDIGKAKRAAAKGPVIITDRGEPAHVLLSIDEYRALAGEDANIAELLFDSKAAKIEFDPPKARDSTLKVPNVES